ncbi:MAG TPA: PhoPQ-activated protein PqaA family protein [Fimbriimonas sp.]|nr:PhoPQ-activated protein PqaA family protein [Fimbriimonas sp.]
MMLFSLLALVPLSIKAPREFYDYLAKPDPAYSTTVIATPAETKIEMLSQVWQGIPWKHTILYRQPKNTKKNGIAILYITGDGPRPADLLELSLVVGATGMPVAELFNVPNQPMWDMKEDDLIAHTFEKYLETDDATWPLLFPMAKSAIRAMDAVEEATKGSDNPITKFVVTGASKRGWTTWFVGAAKDKRVLGIAPLVIDNLNIPAQMPHQIKEWGKYSEQIEEYTRRGLQAKLLTPKGRHLTEMIDPYFYRDEIKIPTLIVTGANDPYWTVDAMSKYWGDLRMPHWASIVPNAGHDMGNKVQAIEAVGAFAHSLAGDFKMPKVTWDLKETGESSPTQRVFTLAARSDQSITQMRILANRSETTDFRLGKWEPLAEVKMDGASGPTAPVIKFLVPKGQNVALLAEARFKLADRSFTLSRPVTVFKR